MADRIFPPCSWDKTDKLKIGPETEKRSLTGDSNKDSREDCSYRHPSARRLRKGQPGRIHVRLGQLRLPLVGGENLFSDTDSPGNLEVLTEVDTLDLRSSKKNRSGAAKRRARRARLAEAPTGDFTGGRPPVQGSQTQTPQGPSTSGLQNKESENPLRQEPSTCGLKP